jgi:hypothetical protein
MQLAQTHQCQKVPTCGETNNFLQIQICTSHMPTVNFTLFVCVWIAIELKLLIYKCNKKLAPTHIKINKKRVQAFHAASVYKYNLSKYDIYEKF